MLYSNIPIFINNKEHLTDLKGCVEDLLTRGYVNIHIMDNKSDYPPLIAYYNEIVNNPKITVHRFDVNYGDKCLWNSGLINHYMDQPYIILTTSDIRLNPETPDNFVEIMISKLEQHPGYNKIGLALALDFERNSEYQKWSYDWEQQFWQNKIESNPDLYIADVDTTFVVLRPGPHEYKALRIASEFTCKHMTWYIDFAQHIPDEELYYLSKATDESFYKGFYNKFLQSQKL